jgi:hypothetical protein
MFGSNKLLRVIIDKLNEMIALEEDNANRLKLIYAAVVPKAATNVTITQLNGDPDMITGTPLGTTSRFRATFNGALKVGSVPVWSTTDTGVTLVPSADGLECDASLSLADTLTNYPLTVTGVASDGTTVTATVQVPELPAPPAPATSVSIDQVS